jgi:hypothetical protein
MCLRDIADVVPLRTQQCTAEIVPLYTYPRLVESKETSGASGTERMSKRFHSRRFQPSQRVASSAPCGFGFNGAREQSVDVLSARLPLDWNHAAETQNASDARQAGGRYLARYTDQSRQSRTEGRASSASRLYCCAAEQRSERQ